MLAGRILALAYMLCVLMPAISFAFADGALAAPCLTDPDHVMGVAHVHEAAAGTVQHVHHDGYDHGDHAKAAHHGDVFGLAKQVAGHRAPADHEHKGRGAQCCGMVCVSALPATATELVAPSAPTSRCASDIYRNVAGNSPPTLYRPPIS